MPVLRFYAPQKEGLILSSNKGSPKTVPCTAYFLSNPTDVNRQNLQDGIKRQEPNLTIIDQTYTIALINNASIWFRNSLCVLDEMSILHERY